MLHTSLLSSKVSFYILQNPDNTKPPELRPVFTQEASVPFAKS